MKRKEDNGRKRDGQCSVWVPHIFEELKKAVYVNLLLQLFRFYNKLGQ